MVCWYPVGRWVTKPLIMISLAYFYYKSANKFDKLFFAALVFALIGDSFLLFDIPNFFLFGLGSFLIMQILYSIVFLRQRAGSTNRKALITMIVYFFWPWTDSVSATTFGFNENSCDCLHFGDTSYGAICSVEKSSAQWIFYCDFRSTTFHDLRFFDIDHKICKPH